MSLPKATVATTSIIGKILAASRPRWRLSPALWDTKPTIAGPIEPPISPAIAKKAKEKKVGARALRAIIEEFMLDIMYEIPKDDNIGKVTITEDYVEKKGGPLIQMRGVAEIPERAGAM